MKNIKFNDKKNIISQRVAIARKNLSLTQQELASRLQTYGVSIDQQAISKIEKNLRIVTDYEVLTLASVLKVSVHWLLTGEDDL